MQIKDSAIQFYSDHSTIERHQRRGTFLSRGARGALQELSPQSPGRVPIRPTTTSGSVNDRVSISLHPTIHSRRIQPEDIDLTEDQQFTVELNIRLLKALFEKITGRKFQLAVPFEKNSSDAAAVETERNHPPSTVSSGSSEQREGGGLVYEFVQSHYESEKTSFQASGIVNTADGEEIEINLGLSMSREFYSEENIRVGEDGVLKDPLIVNFSGTTAQITQRDFQFDIDADGTTEQIGFVAPGSGFLALDKNSDGIINDGSELFGALTGDGFADLRASDDDGNGWIDEDDKIYKNLRIWSRSDSGEQELVGLGELGVGALYLDHIETQFSQKDSDNQLLGQVRKTGIALMESGRSVTIQQLDLVA